MGKKNDESIDINIKKIINYKHFPLILLMIISFALNIYYFNTNKAVWWDEAAYLSFKNYMLEGTPHSLWEGRAIIYPLMLSLFGMLNSQEGFLRACLILINIGCVFSCYILIKKISKPKIAFFSALLLQTSFLFMFFQIRFLTEIPSAMFLMLGIYFFLDKNIKSKILSGIFFGLAIGTRFTSIIIIPSLILYNLLAKSKIRDYAWIPSILIGFVPQLIYDLTIGKFPFYSIITFLTFSSGHALNQPWHYYISSFYIYGLVSLPFFIIGLLKYSKLNAKKILIISFFSLYLLMHSFASPHKEDRYILPIIPFYFFIAVDGMFFAAGKILKKENFQIVCIAVLCAIISYQSITLANLSISAKAESYFPVREASEFLDNYLPKEAIIIGNTPQINYDSNRQMVEFPKNSSDLYYLLEKNKNINTLVVSLFESVPDYSEIFNSENFTIIKAGFLMDQAVAFTISYNRK